MLFPPCSQPWQKFSPEFFFTRPKSFSLSKESLFSPKMSKSKSEWGLKYH